MGRRLFFGVKIFASPALLNVYKEVQQAMLNNKIKWVDASNMHLTLSFLGNTDEKFISSLKHILEKLSEKNETFDLTLSSFGVFKNIHNPTVVWIGVEKNETFNQIKKELDTELEKLGIETENREFNPHLTLGRPKFINDKRELVSLIEKFKNKSFDKQNISDLILFESLPGPVYKPLYSCKLK
jgi:2'-5' RNA ligase